MKRRFGNWGNRVEEEGKKWLTGTPGGKGGEKGKTDDQSGWVERVCRRGVRISPVERRVLPEGRH